MLAPYIASYRKRLEALPGGPYPGVDPDKAAVLAATVKAMESPGSVSRIEEARLGDSENGLFDYLRAIAEADPRDAIAHIRRGNESPLVHLTVEKNPIVSYSPALNAIQSLSERIGDLVATDRTAASALLGMAVRIARAEPHALIHLVIGVSIVNAVLKEDAMAARKNGDREWIASSAGHATQYRDWMTSVHRFWIWETRFAPLIEMRFCRLGGITSADLNAYYKGELADLEKVAAVEATADLAYRGERPRVVRHLKGMPNG
jgi:hypothetical protein